MQHARNVRNHADVEDRMTPATHGKASSRQNEDAHTAGEMCILSNVDKGRAVQDDPKEDGELSFYVGAGIFPEPEDAKETQSSTHESIIEVAR